MWSDGVISVQQRVLLSFCEWRSGGVEVHRSVVCGTASCSEIGHQAALPAKGLGMCW